MKSNYKSNRILNNEIGGKSQLKKGQKRVNLVNRPIPLPKSRNKDKLIKCKFNVEGLMIQVMRPR
jgi:hypothetical protein